MFSLVAALSVIWGVLLLRLGRGKQPRGFGKPTLICFEGLCSKRRFPQSFQMPQSFHAESSGAFSFPRCSRFPQAHCEMSALTGESLLMQTPRKNNCPIVPNSRNKKCPTFYNTISTPKIGHGSIRSPEFRASWLSEKFFKFFENSSYIFSAHY